MADDGTLHGSEAVCTFALNWLGPKVIDHAQVCMAIGTLIMLEW